MSIDTLESLFDDVLTWLADLYDVQSGGFYYQYSCLTDPQQFAPDIESTAQALGAIRMSNLLADMPQAMRDGLVRFFDERQDPDSGLFFDTHTDMRTIPRLRSRALNFARIVYNHLDVQPRYPLKTFTPDEVRKWSPHLADTKALVAWMDSLPWDHTWTAIDEIAAQKSMINRLEDHQSEILHRCICEYLDNRQNPDTGFWDGGIPYVQLSGAYKALIAYNPLPLPRPERIYASVMHCLRTQDCDRVTWVSNALNILRHLDKHMQCDQATANGNDGPAQSEPQGSMAACIRGGRYQNLHLSFTAYVHRLCRSEPQGSMAACIRGGRYQNLHLSFTAYVHRLCRSEPQAHAPRKASEGRATERAAQATRPGDWDSDGYKPATPGGIPEQDRADIIRISTDNLAKCRRDDGGFSIEAAGSWAAPNSGIILGKGLVEGDMNSISLAFAARKNIRALVGLPDAPHASAHTFYPRIRKLHPQLFTA